MRIEVLVDVKPILGEGPLWDVEQQRLYFIDSFGGVVYRCTADGREYMMGDDFKTTQPPTVRIKFHGTAPLAKVTLVKDDVETVLGEPNKAEFETSWTDKNPTPGKESYYYVRGEQADGELVWASPMWITYQP